jgi:hypothetical protein
VLPYADLSGLIARPTQPPPPQRERMLHFSAESLAALKERARQELLAAGDAAGAAAVTRFQALSSLLWRCAGPGGGVPRVHQQPRAAPAAASGGVLRERHQRRIHGGGARVGAAGARARVGSGGRGARGRGARGRGNPGARGGVGGGAGPVGVQAVRPERHVRQQLAPVRHVRVRLRVGEGAGGAERQGQQVRREGVAVPGAGGRWRHRRGGGAGAGAHGGAGAGRGVLGGRVAATERYNKLATT